MTTPSPATLATSLRTHLAGTLRAEQTGTAVVLGGWVHRSRDLGGQVFLDLRDRGGVVQCSFNPQWTPSEVIAAAAAVGIESVVMIEGTVAPRPAEMRNPEMVTGAIEVRATAIRVVGPAVTPALPVAPIKEGKLPA